MLGRCFEKIRIERICQDHERVLASKGAGRQCHGAGTLAFEWEGQRTEGAFLWEQ